MNTLSDQPTGIGGWLVLPALGLISAPIIVSYQVYRDLLPALSPEIWNALTDPRSAAYHPMWQWVILSELAANIFYVVFTLWLLWLFFNKARIAPKLFVAWLVFNILLPLGDAMLVSLVPISVGEDGTSALVQGSLRSFVAALIWIPYFLISRRVKNTFTQPVPWSRRSRASAGTAAS